MKELEQRLQFLATHEEEEEKKKKIETENNKEKKETDITETAAAGFSEFFTHPQYSSSGPGKLELDSVGEVEVRMAERHGNIKIRTRRRRKQLLRMVSGFHALRLTILHLNATTTPDRSTVLYSLAVKVISLATATQSMHLHFLFLLFTFILFYFLKNTIIIIILNLKILISILLLSVVAEYIF